MKTSTLVLLGIVALVLLSKSSSAQTRIPYYLRRPTT